MFIVLSMIVSATGCAAVVGIVPIPGLLAASASNSEAARNALLRKPAHTDGDASPETLGRRPRGEQIAIQPASDDCPYMKPTSCVSARSPPKWRSVIASAQRANRPPAGSIAAACHSAPGQNPDIHEWS